MTKAQEKAAEDLCESIICSSDQDSWESVAKQCVEDNEKISDLNIKDEIVAISLDKELQIYPSALYYHGKGKSSDD